MLMKVEYFEGYNTFEQDRQTSQKPLTGISTKAITKIYSNLREDIFLSTCYLYN